MIQFDFLSAVNQDYTDDHLPANLSSAGPFYFKFYFFKSPQESYVSTFTITRTIVGITKGLKLNQRIYHQEYDIRLNFAAITIKRIDCRLWIIRNFLLCFFYLSNLAMSLSYLTKISKKVFNSHQNIRKNSMRAFSFYLVIKLIYIHFLHFLYARSSV